MPWVNSIPLLLGYHDSGESVVKLLLTAHEVRHGWKRDWIQYLPLLMDLTVPYRSVFFKTTAEKCVQASPPRLFAQKFTGWHLVV